MTPDGWFVLNEVLLFVDISDTVARIEGWLSCIWTHGVGRFDKSNNDGMPPDGKLTKVFQAPTPYVLMTADVPQGDSSIEGDAKFAGTS